MEKIKNFKNKLLKSPVLFFILVGLYPVVFLVSKNWFVYQTRQLLFLLIIPVLTGLGGFIIVGLLWLFNRFIRNKLLTRIPEKLRNLTKRFIENQGLTFSLLGLFGFTIFYFLLETSLNSRRLILYSYIAIAVAVCYFIRKIGFYYINLILLIMTLIASFELVYAASTKSLSNDMLVEGLNNERDLEVKFKKKPNIYLIHLESYNSPEATRKIYNFDNSEFIKSLSDNGFFVSQDSFSNYSTTILSIGAIFLQQHHYHKIALGADDAIGARDMVGGRLYNPVLTILKNNGYKILFLQRDNYAFMGSSYLDYYYPQDSLHDSLLIFQSKKINSIRGRIFNLKKQNRKETAYSDKDILQKIIDAKLEEVKSDTQPRFTYIKDAGAQHTPSNGTYTWENSEEGWNEKYIKKIKAENPDILATIKKIEENDPKAIIILYGDHGPHKYRGVWGQDADKNDVNLRIFNRNKMDGKTLAYDLFGTFLAVRYPDGNSKILDGETHVNIFRKLFSDLSETDTLLKDKPANDSLLRYKSDLLYMVRDGKVLDKIESIKVD